MTNLLDLEQRVSGGHAQLGKPYITVAKESKSLSLSLDMLSVDILVNYH